MKELFYQYKFSIVGGVVGLVLAALFFTLGFWKTILSIVIVLIGAAIGFSRDKDVDVKEYFDDFWSNDKGWK